MSAPVTILSDVAQAVVAALTAGLVASSFSQPFEPERSYADWELPLDDVASADLRCDVVPVNKPAIELATRGKVKYTVAVDLVVRRKLNTNDQDPVTGRIERAVIDNLVGLVLEIERYFITDRFADYPDAVWERTEVRAAYIGQHLRELRQFTGIVRLFFAATQAL